MIKVSLEFVYNGQAKTLDEVLRNIQIFIKSYGSKHNLRLSNVCEC